MPSSSARLDQRDQSAVPALQADQGAGVEDQSHDYACGPAGQEVHPDRAAVISSVVIFPSSSS